MNFFAPETAPAVLLYNFSRDKRTEAIEAFLSSVGVRFSHVPVTDFNRRIGALLSLPGAEMGTNSVTYPFFTDEMLVMSGFSQDMLQDFLSFFREKQLRRVALKAMLTPTNASWSGAELVRHLKQEQAQFEKAAKRR